MAKVIEFEKVKRIRVLSRREGKTMVTDWSEAAFQAYRRSKEARGFEFVERTGLCESTP